MSTPYNPYGNDGQNENNSQGDANPYGGSSYDQSAGGAYNAAGSFPTGGGANQPMGERPANYLVWAILATVLCCLPTGIASIIFATQVNSKWEMGDFAGAQESSAKAKKWAIISAVLGIVVTIVSVIIQVMLGGLAETTSSY